MVRPKARWASPAGLIFVWAWTKKARMSFWASFLDPVQKYGFWANLLARSIFDSSTFKDILALIINGTILFSSAY